MTDLSALYSTNCTVVEKDGDISVVWRFRCSLRCRSKQDIIDEFLARHPATKREDILEVVGPKEWYAQPEDDLY